MNIQPSLSLGTVSVNGKQPHNLPTEIFKKLQNNHTEVDILQTSVEIIYEALKCDRVVVYGMQSDSLCKILAEAVTPGYAQILGTIIKDVCFENGYIEKYRKGRVRAIDDVQTSDISSCHLEALQSIDIKANLVVPLIAQNNSLYGLLVMHQCSRTRQWKQPEIAFVLQMADWVMEQVSNYKAHVNLETQVKNNEHARQLITKITTEIHGATTSQTVLQLGVEQAQAITECDRVIVYSLVDCSIGKIVAEATVPALASILGSVIKDPCFEYRYIDKYQQGRIRSIPNIYEAGMSACYIDNLAKIGVKSNLVAPINLDNGKIYGLLVAHQCFSFKDWQSWEIEYFQEIAFHTGLSLSKAKLEEKAQTIVTGFDQLSGIKNDIAQAKFRLQQIQDPIQNTNQILVEIANLNKLLEREINLINQNGSLQTKKDTKLIQIITKKLAIITAKLKRSINVVDNSQDEVSMILDEVIGNMDESEIPG